MLVTHPSPRQIKQLRESLGYTQFDAASLIGSHLRSWQQWEAGNRKMHPAFWELFCLKLGRPLLNPFDVTIENTVKKPKFTFIDLFAGIGGLRLGFEAVQGKCVFTSEWDEGARKTYLANFSSDHRFVGDITACQAESIPLHDVLLAGFPCQPFSIAGIGKKNAMGLPHGFDCDIQGTLFFDIVRILAAKRQKAFLLENVKNLVSHDKGRTFKKIIQTLTEDLGYAVHWKIIDGQHFVPQHRERIFIVGFRDKTDFSWSSLKMPDRENLNLGSILHPEDGTELVEEPYTFGEMAQVHSKYTLSDKLWSYLQSHAQRQKMKGNGFHYNLADRKSIAATLSARYYKDGAEILIPQREGLNPRKLTPRECRRLMGFPNRFIIPVSDVQAYRQFGNSVIVPVVEAIAHIILPCLRPRRALDNTLNVHSL